MIPMIAGITILNEKSKKDAWIPTAGLTPRDEYIQAAIPSRAPRPAMVIGRQTPKTIRGYGMKTTRIGTTEKE